MKPYSIRKYRPFRPVDLPDRQWPNRTIAKAPVWCSVDLRDGNQALPIPMSVPEKLELFELLVATGFKQIEVGFPSSADTEFNFLRTLVEEKRIPADVTVQVLVQAREHLIHKTFEALKGVPRSIVHLYNSTSPLQRRVTFRNASCEEILKIATDGTTLVKELASGFPDQDIRFQYSPESFSDTELEFALEVCEAVKEIWGPTPDRPIILNLPATVEWSTPNVHADQIEWFGRRISGRNSVQISLHTHNDRGTGVAATELGLLAGADRVEGTLFGNGERTGNLDIVTVALNMNSHGIETGLDFSNLPRVRSVFERTTRMTVPGRHPYAGDFVFTAFSGSHQDAIKKGMDLRQRELGSSSETPWAVPYLTIDPEDIGRSYEAIIRINAQSGKGGVAYVLDREHGFDLPHSMYPQVGKLVSDHADRLGRELTGDEIRQIFFEKFVNRDSPLKLAHYDLDHPERDGDDLVCRATIVWKGDKKEISGKGNGPINAFVHALAAVGLKSFKVDDYQSHAVRGGSDADSAAYVQVQALEGNKTVWGCGVHPSIEMAGLKALVCGINLLESGI